MQPRLPGSTAKERAAAVERSLLLRSLGGFVAALHRIPAPGFGFTYDAAAGSFTHLRWSDFVRCRVSELELPHLRNARLFGREQCAWLERRANELSALRSEARLCHRDLLGNWGNVLVDKRCEISGIIDWEFSGGCPAFQYEIASMIYVLLRDGYPDEAIERDCAAVLAGYGMPAGRYKTHYARDVETIVLMNSLSALHRFFVLRTSGGLEQEPWRETFARRAMTLIASRFAEDRRSRRPGAARRVIRRAA